MKWGLRRAMNGRMMAPETDAQKDVAAKKAEAHVFTRKVTLAR